MINRIISIALVLAFAVSLCGCIRDHADQSLSESIEVSKIAQNDTYYIVNTEWMTFYLSKKDFEENTVNDIVTEAVSVMAEIRDYLEVSYTLEHAKGAACYFDSSYIDDKEQNRSQCFWREKLMYCVLPQDFIHEYVHMVTGNNSDMVYKPDDIFIEGLAEYVSINFYGSITGKEYRYFKEADVFSDTNSEAYQAISTFLTQKGLPLNKENYTRLEAHLLYRDLGIASIDKNSDFYKYYIGFVFVDYCIEQLGGLEQFLQVYCDCITASEVYGKTVDALIEDACEHNKNFF